MTYSSVRMGCLLSKPRVSMTSLISTAAPNCPGPAQAGGQGEHVPPTLLGRSVNPISTRWGTLFPPSITCPPRFSDLATALQCHTSQSKGRYGEREHSILLVLIVSNLLMFSQDIHEARK